MDAAVDKGNALKMIQKRLDITAAETMAFGDNDNDLGLLAAAQESYAVESARDSVKEQAKHVCPGYSERGVYRVITELMERQRS